MAGQRLAVSSRVKECSMGEPGSMVTGQGTERERERKGERKDKGCGKERRGEEQHRVVPEERRGPLPEHATRVASQGSLFQGEPEGLSKHIYFMWGGPHVTGARPVWWQGGTEGGTRDAPWEGGRECPPGQHGVWQGGWPAEEEQGVCGGNRGGGKTHPLDKLGVQAAWCGITEVDKTWLFPEFFRSQGRQRRESDQGCLVGLDWLKSFLYSAAVAMGKIQELGRGCAQ